MAAGWQIFRFTCGQRRTRFNYTMIKQRLVWQRTSYFITPKTLTSNVDLAALDVFKSSQDKIAFTHCAILLAYGIQDSLYIFVQLPITDLTH